jgi:chromosome segregation ATPase
MTYSGTDTSATPSPSVASDQYSQEIVELNHVVWQNSESSEAKMAHLKLAKLYSDYNNHRRNYGKALKHLEAYIILENSVADDETMNWMAALKEIDHLSKEITQVKKQLKKSNRSKVALTKTNRKLTREEIKLREKNRKLEESNQKLKKTIEMLKNLDQRLEEKRKNFNN